MFTIIIFQLIFISFFIFLIQEFKKSGFFEKEIVDKAYKKCDKCGARATCEYNFALGRKLYFCDEDEKKYEKELRVQSKKSNKI